MGKFELSVNPTKETWNIHVDSERRYWGIGCPYDDKEFSRTLDDLCESENTISLRGAFQKYDFRKRPIMFHDYPNGCTPIIGSNDFVRQEISDLLQNLVDEYCTNGE
jgi:hypothetical protein